VRKAEFSWLYAVDTFSLYVHYYNVHMKIINLLVFQPSLNGVPRMLIFITSLKGRCGILLSCYTTQHVQKRRFCS